MYTKRKTRENKISAESDYPLREYCLPKTIETSVIS